MQTMQVKGCQISTAKCAKQIHRNKPKAHVHMYSWKALLPKSQAKLPWFLLPWSWSYALRLSHSYKTHGRAPHHSPRPVAALPRQCLWLSCWIAQAGRAGKRFLVQPPAQNQGPSAGAPCLQGSQQFSPVLSFQNLVSIPSSLASKSFINMLKSTGPNPLKL